MIYIRQDLNWFQITNLSFLPRKHVNCDYSSTKIKISIWEISKTVLGLSMPVIVHLRHK